MVTVGKVVDATSNDGFLVKQLIIIPVDSDIWRHHLCLKIEHTFTARC